MFKHFWSKVILTIIFSLLVFPNLGIRTLWQDEAETALVARQMVKSNNWLPYAYDDQGPINQDWNYQFSVSKLWRWHPWLQFYVTILSFKFFGVSALTARLPFTLIGILFFWYWLGFIEKHGPKNKLFYFLAVSLVLTSVPLLLHIRQARYYSLALLFTLMAVDGYLLNLKRTVLSKRGPSFKYILGSILLFHSFLPGALALQISFWIHQIYRLIRPGLAMQQGRAFIRFAATFSTTLIFTLPWAWWLKIGGQNLNFNLEIIKQNLHWHYVYIHKFIFPVFLLIPFLFSGIRSKILKNNNGLLFLLIIITTLGLYTINHPYFFRYLVPLVPFFTYLAARIIVSLPKKLAIAATFIAFFPGLRLLPDYLFEIAHPYIGTNEQIIAMLNSEKFSGTKSLAVNYDDFTFRFHTNLIVHGAQELTKLNTCPDSVIIFPEWGNEDLLENIANGCHLENYPSEISYAKLADDPSPVNHRFTPPQTGSIKIFVKPPESLVYPSE
ncbi:hypothetical protein HZB78_06025 [Candidatus Collierbacteria bacterium]|nr:hypothetical protein [Candidatus Collierbacteria bacterium]